MGRRTPAIAGPTRAAACTGALLALLGAPAAGQDGVRPADQPPPLPTLEEQPETPPIELPPLDEGAPSRPGEGLRLDVRVFEVQGSTVFSPEELAAVTRPYHERSLSNADLAELTGALTRLYISRGYVTSRAYLPDQDAEDGVVRIRIVEGRVSTIAIEGNEQLRDSYLRARIAQAARAPLNARKLARRLEILQRDRQIERITAVLGPGEGVGAHTLRVRVEERFPWALSVTANDHRSPSIGSTGGGIDLLHWSALGWGESLSVRARFTEGLHEVGGRFAVPLTVYDTELALAYRYSESDIVEKPFDALDIHGSLHSASVELRQPLFRSRGLGLYAGVRGDWRRARSRLLGRTVCFQAEVSECEPTVFAVRLQQEADWRGRRFALAARSSFSLGVDALGATVAAGGGPEGRFFAWLGQLQFAWIPPLPEAAPGWLARTQIVGRGDLQLADAPLLSIEQIAVGGARTVRGYRENLLVRDNGAVGALELRVPLLEDAFDRPLLELAPFVDIGHAWNVRSGLASETISSVGIGVRIHPFESVHGELYWGHRLQDQIVKGDALQRHGLHFQLVWNVF